MSSEKRNVSVIILAAGLGTRMKSDKAKVLHEIAGKAMIHYVVETALDVTDDSVVLVLGHQADKVKVEVSQYRDLSFAHQPEQLGTGHAAQCALPQIADKSRHVVILCGDSPLLRASSINRLIEEHIYLNHDLTVLAFEDQNPTGYGRIIIDESNRVKAIVEEADATQDQKAIKIVNSGIYCVEKDFLFRALKQIRADNAQREYYLTDIVKLASLENRSVGMNLGLDKKEFMGVNSIDELKLAEFILKGGYSKTA
jgi:UDP-N-acetylglucosamine diphosphorylase/glucosamine-1-phosphate N-acetyltransferase